MTLTIHELLIPSRQTLEHRSRFMISVLKEWFICIRCCWIFHLWAYAIDLLAELLCLIAKGKPAEISVEDKVDLQLTTVAYLPVWMHPYLVMLVLAMDSNCRVTRSWKRRVKRLGLVCTETAGSPWGVWCSYGDNINRICALSTAECNEGLRPDHWVWWIFKLSSRGTIIPYSDFLEWIRIGDSYDHVSSESLWKAMNLTVVLVGKCPSWSTAYHGASDFNSNICYPFPSSFAGEAIRREGKANKLRKRLPLVKSINPIYNPKNYFQNDRDACYHG